MEGGAAIDEFIGRLLEGKKSKAGGKKIQLSEAELRHIRVLAKEFFLNQPCVLELEASINVCGTGMHLMQLPGDIHGQYSGLLELLEYGGFPLSSNSLAIMSTEDIKASKTMSSPRIQDQIS